MEMAFWIGPRPGVPNSPEQERDLNLDQYRDRRHPILRRTQRQSRWVVFHLHMHRQIIRQAEWGGRPQLNVVRQSIFFRAVIPMLWHTD